MDTYAVNIGNKWAGFHKINSLKQYLKMNLKLESMEKNSKRGVLI